MITLALIAILIILAIVVVAAVVFIGSAILLPFLAIILDIVVGIFVIWAIVKLIKWIKSKF